MPIHNKKLRQKAELVFFANEFSSQSGNTDDLQFSFMSCLGEESYGMLEMTTILIEK